MRRRVAVFEVLCSWDGMIRNAFDSGTGPKVVAPDGRTVKGTVSWRTGRQVFHPSGPIGEHTVKHRMH